MQSPSFCGKRCSPSKSYRGLLSNTYCSSVSFLEYDGRMLRIQDLSVVVFFIFKYMIWRWSLVGQLNCENCDRKCLAGDCIPLIMILQRIKGLHNRSSWRHGAREVGRRGSEMNLDHHSLLGHHWDVAGHLATYKFTTQTIKHNYSFFIILFLLIESHQLKKKIYNARNKND